MSDTPVPTQSQPVIPDTNQTMIDPVTGVVLPYAAITQMTKSDPLNPPSVGGAPGGKKEAISAPSSGIEDVPGVQVIEQEPNVEIGPEVQGWIEKAKQDNINIPKEVVVADNTAMSPTGVYAAQPVIVLPLTQKKLQQGLHMDIKHSVRWLAVWCVRLMKKFHGTVVYRQE